MAIEVIKNYRNESGAPKIIFNKIVADGETYTIPRRYWVDAPNEIELLADIASGDIVVNDGTTDLSPADALEWIKRWQLDEAADIPFDNSTNGFNAGDTQAAVEELASNLSNSASISCQFTENGTAKENDYLRVGDTSGDDVGFLIPFDGVVVVFSASNNNSSGNKELEIVRRRPAQTGPNVVIATLSIPNGQFALNSNPAVEVLAGDELLVRVADGSADFDDTICSLVITKEIGGGGGPGGPGGSGEENTASNRGAGEGTFFQKTGVDLEFKSLVAGSNVTLSSDNDEITINSTASGDVSNGTNLGGGEEVFKQKTGSNLEFRTITSSGNAIVSTIGDTINVNVPGNGNAFSAGSVNGNGTTNSLVNATVTRTSVGEYSVSFVTPASDTNYIVLLTLEQNPGTDDYSIAYTNVTTGGFDVEIKEQDDGGGGGVFRDSGYSFLVPFTEGGTTPNGETNTASNLGAGEGLFQQKVGVDLQFKSLVAGSNVSLSSTGNEVTINATDTNTGEDNTASNQGAGSQVFIQKTGVDLEFRSFIGSGSAVVSQNADTIEVNVPAIPTIDPDVNKVTLAVTTSGGQDVTSGADITFDTTALESTTVASHTPGGSVITINKTGIYEITALVSLENTANSRTAVDHRIEVNGTLLPGTEGYTYHRNDAEGEMSYSVTTYASLSSGDTVNVNSARNSGGGTLLVIANGATLGVKYLRASN